MLLLADGLAEGSPRSLITNNWVLLTLLRVSHQEKKGHKNSTSPPHPPAPLDVLACTSSALTPPRLKLTANIPVQKVLLCERSLVSVELLCACSISTAGDEVPSPRGWGITCIYSQRAAFGAMWHWSLTWLKCSKSEVSTSFLFLLLGCLRLEDVLLQGQPITDDLTDSWHWTPPTACLSIMLQVIRQILWILFLKAEEENKFLFLFYYRFGGMGGHQATNPHLSKPTQSCCTIVCVSYDHVHLLWAYINNNRLVSQYSASICCFYARGRKNI